METASRSDWAGECKVARMRIYLGQALMCLVPLLAGAQPQASYTLRGQALDAATGQPLSGLKVVLEDPVGFHGVADPVYTGADGRFVFSGVKTGRYILAAVLYGETIRYREQPDGSFFTVPVGIEGQPEEIAFRVALHPSISGTVRDQFGDPVKGAYISALSGGWRDGQVVFDQTGHTTTDDRGQYRMAPLQPGIYSVCAFLGDSSFGGNPTPAQSSVVDFAAQTEERHYTRPCYPGEPPETFRLDWGQDSQVDLKLDVAPSIKVKGRVNNWIPGRPFSLSLAWPYPMGQLPGGLQADGTFEFEVPQPGWYSLEASQRAEGTSRGLVAKRSLHVDSTGLRGIELTAEAPAEFDVYVRNPTGAPSQKFSLIVNLLERDVRDRKWAIGADYDGDGTIHFHSVPPNDYWIATYTKAPFCVDSIRYAGQDVLRGAISLGPAERGQLDVTLSTECSSISGKVSRQSKPAAFDQVWLLLSGSAQSPGQMMREYTDEEGNFSFTLLPPGRYQLWAWSSGELSFPGPTHLSDVEKPATTVEVRKGQQGVVQVMELGGRK